MQAKKLQAAALSTQPVFVESVFSTYLYTGNGSTQTINNGIDLAGEGGLVWLKSRSTADNHFLFDTTRGATKLLQSNTTGAEITNANTLTSFAPTGFSLGTETAVNRSGTTFASWTFRKAEKFFDVVTYTGNLTARTIAHNLGSVPGCIIVKRTDGVSNWVVYHRGVGNDKYLNLNNTNPQSISAFWNYTNPTSTVFSIGANSDVNTNGATYVAYLFAHDAGGFGESGADNVISCGSYTGNGSSAFREINLGYEPQWVLIKNATTVGYNWMLADSMRGLLAPKVGVTVQELKPNTSDAEAAGRDWGVTATGIGITDDHGSINASGNTYIYIAIRRGPMKTPTTGTSVFTPVTQTLATGSFVNTGFVTDMGLSKALSTADPLLESRLTKAYLRTNTTGAESSGSSTWDYMNGYGPTPWSGSGLSSVAYGFRRAPGFMDVCCYTGTGATNAVQHNLGVTPEMVIVKRRDAAATSWSIYNKFLNGGTNPFNYALYFDASDPTANDTYFGAAPTSTTFTVKTRIETNASGGTYVAYLFASAPGVSKVFSYTGNGSSQTINCGFTGGARFVLIKRTDSTGDWYVWDSARGIVAGNDPHLSLNTTAAEVTTDDSVDTDSTGFIVNQLAATNINVNAATYIGLAIA